MGRMIESGANGTAPGSPSGCTRTKLPAAMARRTRTFTSRRGVLESEWQQGVAWSFRRHALHGRVTAEPSQHSDAPGKLRKRVASDSRLGPAATVRPRGGCRMRGGLLRCWIRIERSIPSCRVRCGSSGVEALQSDGADESGRRSDQFWILVLSQGSAEVDCGETDSRTQRLRGIRNRIVRRSDCRRAANTPMLWWKLHGEAYEPLLHRFSKTHAVQTLIASPRSAANYPELACLGSEAQRAVDEYRLPRQRWLYARAKPVLQL